MKKSKKDRLFTAGLILMLLAGLSLLLYPSVSNYLNSVRQAQSILTYDNEVAGRRTISACANRRRSITSRCWIAPVPTG